MTTGRHVELSGQRVLVVGLGASGLAATRLLTARGARVVVNDRRDEHALGDQASQARDLGADVALGSHDESLFTSVDRIVLSPGVPRLPALETAERHGVPIASEVELASWFIEAPIAAITGTNGKSTVTSWVGAICERTGRPTFVGGNIGTPLCDAVGTAAAASDGFVVAEVSSFQLERVDRFRPRVAALLNVTEDHLDRYDTFADYAAAKGRIFHAQTPDDHAVVLGSDAVCEALARAGAAPVHRFGPGGEVTARDGSVVDAVTGLSVPLDELPLVGAHNVLNAAASALVARLMGAQVAAIGDGLRRFAGLPHRMELVRELDGVRYYDDSKATNVGAAVAALEGFADRTGGVVLIAGGRDKGGAYDDLRAGMDAVGRGLVLVGEAAGRIEAAFTGSRVPVSRATGLEEAVSVARAVARPGDAVLLAPACSSFDMFSSYAERGEVFQRAVAALGGDS